jgi:menaquinone-dependent protoporphyrinogen oxidase
VWLFSSGPLSTSAEERDIPPVASVVKAAELLNARGHATFGGRLGADAQGFPASAMAKTRGGDFRSAEQIHAWVADIVWQLHAVSR